MTESEKASKERISDFDGFEIEEPEELAYASGGAGVPAGIIPEAVIQGKEKDEEDLAYASGGAGVPSGTIPTAVVQGQGKRKKPSFTYNKKQFEL